jgi:hypothetical protein
MSRNLPAYRYDVFIKAFEAHVAAHQQQIDALRGMERPYNLVKEALEAVRLPHEQELILAHASVSVTMTATPDTLLSAFDPLVEAIGKRLLGAQLHRDGEPAVDVSGTFRPEVEYRWRLIDYTKSVLLTVAIPEAGLPDLKVERVKHVTEWESYRLTRIEAPTWAAPAFPVAAGPEAGLVAALDDEVPF